MSPVITKVSGRPSFSEKLTVVSSVLGKQFPNSHASSLSLPRKDSISLTVSSTALLRNFLSRGAGRTAGHRPAMPEAGKDNPAVPGDNATSAAAPGATGVMPAVPAAILLIPTVTAAPATMLFLINLLRVGILLSLNCRFVSQRNILDKHLTYIPVLLQCPVDLDLQL